MKLASLALASSVVVLSGLAACSSDDDASAQTTLNGPNGARNADNGTGPNGRIETDLVFSSEAQFAKRDCSVTIRWEGGGGDIKIAGEFTSPAWADGAKPLTNVNGAFEIKLDPSSGGATPLEPGRLYAYKLVTDGTWRLDPKGLYRKIVGGQMNSGFVLPMCQAGPELRSDRVAIDGSTMKVRVAVKVATDGEGAQTVKASLDNGAIPNGSFVVDNAAGAVDFTFADLAKGKHTLSLRALDKKGRESEPIDLPFWIEDEAFDYRDGILYMLLIDRFANGDKTNDKPIGAPVHYDADWHGGDLQGALEVMKTGYFDKLGVRTIWLSPLNMQTDNHHFGDGGQIYSAYHGYWPIRSREVEPRFGGDAALRAFVAEAHKRGMRVLLDLINNQVHQDHEYVKNPLSASWFRTSCQCGDDANGCGWSVRPFDCMFQPYLPDINWTQPGAEKQFIADAVNWISAFDLDGFRVDAVKHVEANSVYNMRAEISRRFEQGGARVFMVGETAVGEFDSGNFFGEYFANGFDWIDAYTGPNALDGQFDFPTRHNMADGLVNGDKPLNEVEDQLRKSETRYRPGNRHVRFLNGHDNPRIASIAAKDPKLGCTWSSGCRDDQLPPVAYTDPAVYARLRRALTVLYSIPGVPYLYMGDEVAFPGGGDPDMRRNMRFGEGLGAFEMAKPGASVIPLNSQQADLREWVRKLGATRASSRALRRGDRVTLLAEGDLWVYAYQSGPREIAIVAINRGGAVSSRSINVGALSLGGVTGWTSTLGTGSATLSGSNLSLSIGGGEAAIFVAR